MTTREAFAAGTLYSADTHRLLAQVEAWLEQGRNQHTDCAPVKALIAPHSGYFASGNVTAAAYRPLIPQYDQIKRVIIVGAAHKQKIGQIAVPAANTFKTPLGTVQVDQQSVSDLLAFDQVIESDEHHVAEHSIELQLPFLQTLLEDFSIVPLVTSQCDFQYLAEVLDSLWGGPETLIVVSSGLSRHLPLNEATEQDSVTAAKILTCESTIEDANACGYAAINALLSCAAKHGLAPAQRALTTSASSGGKSNRVRGFGAFVFYDKG
ncbi:AmmeMemoRadiSam system protein B [Reinekea marinisedimentorum]|uniref:MEMO1 family protein n=1 Tax=Reinekea marinisedimentorum TaxID=230495 RepID=A0A4R3IB99_9GAMM|nr:AmmeMemoRadiSam system protein B [Reinekea marinisedimentorum]TCS43889.1 hypothetical protein BCF53_101232 [Reinekea marinisedimentorum]